MNRQEGVGRGLRIAVVANTSWYLYNFRSNLIRALREGGHTVLAVGGEGEFATRLRAEGTEHHPVRFSESGTNPFRELTTVLALRRVFARERIDLVLSYTPKGNLYSALALAGRPGVLFMNVSGLGAGLAQNGALALIVRGLYRLCLRRSNWVFFQNTDDMSHFLARGMVDSARVSRLPGSGVDLSRFSATAPDEVHATAPVFLMVSRLLWDKGVGDFADAARRVQAVHPEVRFRLLGALATHHRGGVPEAVLQGWVEAGVVEYAGVVDDVRPHLAQALCVVLPSVYREGVPRALLEAAASARPVIATDSVGCRDAVDDGITGFLCRPRDPADLARQMMRLLAMPAEDRRKMGQAGREKMMSEFDERQVIEAYRERIGAICGAEVHR